jgi:hypothetical protein
MLVIPNWWVSGGVFIFIYIAGLLQLQVETPIAASYDAEHTLCGSFDTSGCLQFDNVVKELCSSWLGIPALCYGSQSYVFYAHSGVIE